METQKDELIEKLDRTIEALDEISEQSGWKPASSADVERLLRTDPTPVEHKVPIDEEGKIFITLWIKELPITEQLDMLELFMTFDKAGNTRLKWKQYYAHAYTRMVVRTEPTIKWREARFFNKKFMNILMEYLPNPFEDDKVVPGHIDEDTQKN